MRRLPTRRWLVSLGMMLGLVLQATPTAQQCYLDISAYAGGAVSGYDANGNGMLSHHMRGRAIDMYQWGGNVPPYWSQAEFDALRMIAQQTNYVESFLYNQYADHHYHAAW